LSEFKKLITKRKHLLNAMLLALPVFGYSQIFQEDFDGTGPGITAWTVINADGLTPMLLYHLLPMAGTESTDKVLKGTLEAR
jgi:hypothetical protein